MTVGAKSYFANSFDRCVAAATARIISAACRLSPISTSSAAAVVPPGEVTFWRSVAEESSERCSSSPEPATVSRASLVASCLRQARLDAGARQFLGEQEDIGRPRAGDRGHRIHQTLVSTHSTEPVARSSASATARCAALTFFAATATVMPRPIAAGVLGIARTTRRRRPAASEAIVVPAMIETTSVEGPANGFKRGAGLAEHLRLHRDHQRGDGADILGLRIEPDAFRRQARRSQRTGCGSITATCFGSSPRASQPVSIAPPILPAPASTMVPVMFCKVLVEFNAVTTNSRVVPAKAGTHNHRRF